MQAHNNKKENLVLTKLPTIKRACIQSTLDFNWDFYICLPFKQILLLGILLDYIVKVIKLLYDVPEVSVNCFAAYHLYYKKNIIDSAYDPFLFRLLPKLLLLPDVLSDYAVKFATYHPHYKETIVSNSTWTFVCTTDCLYFSYDWSNFFSYGWNNLSTAFYLAHIDGFCTAEPGLVTKKGELPRTFIYLSNPLQSLSLLLISMISKMRPAIFEYILISECTTISN